MKFLLTYFLIQATIRITLSNSISPRIAYGDIAEPGQFPYHVLFKIDDDYGYNWCGGVLLSENYILTAGDCLEIGNPRKAYLGITNISDASENIVRLSIDPETDFILSPNGKLGLVKINQNLKFSDFIKPAILTDLTLTQENLQGKYATLTGFGVPLTRHADTSKFLRYIEIPIVSSDICEKSYPYFFDNTFLCASSAEGKSFCFGDQGGPLVIKDSNDQNIVIGIAYAQGYCGDTKSPGTYIRLTSYLDWIKKTMNLK
ncbi:chymotrypsinogen A-like [Condylostylus longicornis]|uniref:chymotrypsinogen A-like n=1 Tax=Condylostylus longicornis TaxID=2530218 RepID=UPI00244E4854|nr:chymotrypsinogen A-like [Condylostylus longicornis]